MRRITDSILQNKCDMLNRTTGMTYAVRHRNGYAGLDLMRGSAVVTTLAIGTNREIALVIDALITHEIYAPERVVLFNNAE